MPDYYVAPSGMVVFKPTKEEKEVQDLRETLQKEVDEVRSLKDELMKELQEVKKLREGE